MYILNLLNFNLTEIENIITKLEFRPTDIFIPIEYYTDNEFWDVKYKDFARTNGNIVILGGYKMRIHWSNNFVPFNQIIISSPSAFECIKKKSKDMKPPPSHKKFSDKNEFVDISMKFYDDKKIGVLVRSVIKIDIKEPKNILIINIENKKNIE